MGEYPRIEHLRVNNTQVLKSGDKGPNIIFLHNAGQVPDGMQEHIGRLAVAGQVIAPNIFDLIRSLRSEGIKKPSFADIAYKFSKLDLLDKNQKTGIVASSFGGSVAWEYNLQHTQNVEWNVAGSPTGWPLRRSLGGWVTAFIREFYIDSNKIPKDLRKRDTGFGSFMKRFLEDPASVVWGLTITMNVDQREQMRNIKQPVDLLWGETDRYIPYWSGEAMSKEMINSRLDVVSGYNHLWMSVEPEKLTGPALKRIKTRD